MRFYTEQHQFYCGIDLHARTMYVCVLNQAGEVLVHRHMKAGPETVLKTIAPYRANLVVCVECTFTCYWLADLCAEEGIPFIDLELYIVQLAKHHDANASTDCAPSQASARFSPWYCSTKFMISIASHGSRSSSRIVSWSDAPRNLLETAMGAREQRSIMPTSSGLSRKPPCSSCATTQRVGRRWPD